MATTTTLQVDVRTVDGVRIRYADSGGSHERAVLLTCPWPESVYAFACMSAVSAGITHNNALRALKAWLET